MEEFGTGAGLAALGFWLFVGLAVVAGAWDSIRRREAQHETLRRIVESGQTVDEHLADRLLSNAAESKNLARDLRVGGIVLGCIAPGMAAMGWLLSITLEPELFEILLAVSILILFISTGLMLAAYMVSRQAKQSSQQHSG
jgi:ABC-type antimicrobial peptide transport system permease subunit